MAGEDKEYIRFIKAQRCAIYGLHRCNGVIDPHHTGRKGLSQRPHDRSAIPLCRQAHIYELHPLKGYFDGWEKSRRKAWELEMVDRYQDLYSASLFSPSGSPQ